MTLASLIERYLPELEARYGDQLLPGHRRAISAIQRCRTNDAGEILWHCHDCDLDWRQPRSCGHRSCPQCQNHEASQWLDRQRAKLLPVEYFMVTFTLPRQLRPLIWGHQRAMYGILMTAAISTLKDFGLNPKHLGAELGMTAILHTHSRRLDFHPHCHVIVPGGGLDKTRRQWRKLKGKYLFNGKALARVFRARILAAINAAGLQLPEHYPRKWVAKCISVGHGEPALKYLSRYLYRGVIGEKQIVDDRDGQVTFRYLESGSGQTCYLTLPGADFLWLVIQHVLPKGFRRVRDVGILHGKARHWLLLVQRILAVIIAPLPPRERPCIACPQCQSPMQAIGFIRPHGQSG
jgi:hypothetical protein